MYCVIEFFESNASLIELSLLAVIITGLTKFSSKHFSFFIFCFSSMSFFSSFFLFYLLVVVVLFVLCVVLV